jgi:phage/plasmid-like protein (TIGR03299 family)
MPAAVETMAWTGRVPWHGLGVEVSNDLTPAQMMKAAGLDWKVVTKPLFINVGTDENPDYQQVRSGTLRSALVRDRDNKTLTMVGDSWNPVQNAEAFDFFVEFCEKGDMEMHTAGSLKGGQIVWVLAKVKDDFTLFNGDKIDSFMLFTVPHLYGKTVDVRSTAVRVVCNNTLVMAHSGDSKIAVSMNHRKVFDAELVKERLGLARKDMEVYKEKAVFLGSKRYDRVQAIEYLVKTFPSSGEKISKNAEKAILALEHQPGVEFAPGTWWQAFNAVTYVTDHLAGKSADTRLATAWYGPTRAKKIDALDRAIEYAKAA